MKKSCIGLKTHGAVELLAVPVGAHGNEQRQSSNIINLRIMLVRVPLTGVIVVALLAGLAHAGSAADGELELVPIGTFSAPIYVAAPPGDGERLFVVEQAGRIRLVRNGTLLTRDFLDITTLVLSGGERGLFSMAFAPDYAASGRFYVYYTAREPEGELTIAEYLRSANPEVAEQSGRIVLSIPHPIYGNHNGGQLQFGPDGYLYIATGTVAAAAIPIATAQNLNSLLGKLLRIDPRGGPGEPYTIPLDNPFVGQASAGEIWAYGLRNPWRFSFDRLTGDLTIGDVGQGSREEIDFLPAVAGGGRGTNLGWSCWEGTLAYQPNYAEAACAPARAVHTAPVWEYSTLAGARSPAATWCETLSSRPSSGATSTAICATTACGRRSCRFPPPRTTGSRGWRCPACTHSVRTPAAASTPSPARGPCLGCTSPASPTRRPVFHRRPAAASRRVRSPRPQPAPLSRLPPAACLAPDAAARDPAGCLASSACGLPPRGRASGGRNCRVGKLRYRRSARPAGGTDAGPRPGARRPRGARVSFTVSRGRR